MPSEFLNADCGVEVKQQLIRQQVLKWVIVFDFSKNIFTGAMTTACILLFENHERPHTTVQFAPVRSLADLDALEKQLDNSSETERKWWSVPYQKLDGQIKWRAYRQKSCATGYRHLVPLTTCGQVKRGIATGDDHDFTFSEEKKRTWGIPDEFFQPCLTRASQAPATFFTADDFVSLKQWGNSVYLLCASHGEHPA